MWSFLWASIRVRVYLVGICSFLVLVCREWRWISRTRNSEFYHGLALPSLIFFCVALWKSIFISAFGPSSNHSNSFFLLFIHLAFSLGFLVAIFSPKSFGFSCIRSLVCFRVISSQLLVECCFVVLKCPILSVLFYPLLICL